MTKYIILYLIVINMVTFLFFASDKFKAMHGKWRIPEATLLLMSLFGGSFGALFAMGAFHHKTRKFLFKFGVPFLCIVHIAIIAYCKSKHIF